MLPNSLLLCRLAQRPKLSSSSHPTPARTLSLICIPMCPPSQTSSLTLPYTLLVPKEPHSIQRGVDSDGKVVCSGAWMDSCLGRAESWPGQASGQSDFFSFCCPAACPPPSSAGPRPIPVLGAREFSLPIPTPFPAPTGAPPHLPPSCLPLSLPAASLF